MNLHGKPPETLRWRLVGHVAAHFASIKRVIPGLDPEIRAQAMNNAPRHT
jgi:hypothetical protein